MFKSFRLFESRISVALACLVAGSALVTMPALAQADAWPSRPITYVSPYPAGSPVDLIARRIAQHIEKTLGQPVVVENKVGAGGTIGTAYVAKAAPDGYTMVAGSISTHAINVSLYPNLPYDAVKDFEPVALIGSTAMALIVSPAKVPMQSVQELVAHAKAHPGAIQFGSAGNGSSPHLAGELFKSMAHVDLTHVPYKGSVGAMSDLLGGQIGAMFQNLPNVMPHVQSGRLRVLAVTGDRRASQLPDVPTVSESVAPGYEIRTWHAVFLPAGTPQPIVRKLSDAILAALSSPEDRAFFAERSIDLTPGGPEALRAYVAQEIPKWRELVQSSGAKID